VRSHKNHPGHVGYTYDFIAEIKKIPVDELIKAASANFKSLFSIT
jgi:Tat protein secretion system quality control protein TatD with DNase activity